MINTAVSIFEIIGPVMVGPSSSHTAGAARIGNIARRICARDIKRVDFYLHGSFARTYKGHGTGKALLGGILGMSASDERIRDSYQLARAAGIDFEFHTVDLGDAHPNTVKIIMQATDGETFEVTGSSIGGGKVVITSINDMVVEFTGQYPTIITNHLDKPGVVAHVTSMLSNNGINIAFLKVFRQARGSQASMVIETDQEVGNDVLAELGALPSMSRIVFIDTDKQLE